MAIKREILLMNQITFRNELIEELSERITSAANIITDLYENGDVGDEADERLLEALKALGARFV